MDWFVFVTPFQVSHWAIGLWGCQVRCCTLRCSSGSLQSCRARVKRRVYLCTARESLMQSLWVSHNSKNCLKRDLMKMTWLFCHGKSLFLQSCSSFSLSLQTRMRRCWCFAAACTGRSQLTAAWAARCRSANAGPACHRPLRQPLSPRWTPNGISSKVHLLQSHWKPRRSPDIPL